jgi:2-methylcitrate dehydratase PrpD
MTDAQIRAVKERVQLVADRKLMDPAAPRSGLVEVTLKDGRTLQHFTKFPPGTKENPVSTEALNAKVRDLIAPVLGPVRAAKLIEQVNNLEDVRDVHDLRPLFT